MSHTPVPGVSFLIDANLPVIQHPTNRDPFLSFAAHRTLITRKLKGLEDFISFTSVHWHLGEKGMSRSFPSIHHTVRSILTPRTTIGWRFATAEEQEPSQNVTSDPNHPEFTHLREIYFAEDPDYSARFTVPVLYDKKTKRIVSNESAEIIRMLYHEFDPLLPEHHRTIDPYPTDLQSEIDTSNDWIYNDVNNGVYKSGFATTQEAYEKAVTQLFASLDRIEEHLTQKKGPYFFGDRITEADIRLFTTIVRFDPVYVQHFKCNIRDIRSGYPAIHRWLRTLYWEVPAFRDTTNFEHIKKHYTKSHKQINPFGITPVGPVPDVLPLEEEVRAVV
ncbi:hypothetical protein BO82DRAFT_350818 [Aspergillus uvarum CBS 121591]|uniref:Glutathione S-transferase omega-like 2 n=1 Tax=Aspergillus uvarum CBS 121591 TaxID=1448315 RepID=A0A319CPK5_9EURO|nr:hypothetical protein BO82DRAFT_350818 [Aspergillus uvarum CBS 121591]PYH86031.1 hypothetical protein BO82DRAFT_350818 [Aspergillus uvarum CBS 121591]